MAIRVSKGTASFILFWGSFICFGTGIFGGYSSDWCFNDCSTSDFWGDVWYYWVVFGAIGIILSARYYREVGWSKLLVESLVVLAFFLIASLIGWLSN
jgi:hypothetical protein